MSKKFLTAVLGGTLFGILFAKKAGKEVRDEIKAAAKKEGWQGGLKVVGKELAQAGEELAVSVKEVGDSPVIQKAKDRVHEEYDDLSKAGQKKFKKLWKKIGF